MRKTKGICWLLILAMTVTLMGCASGGGEETEPSGSEATTAPTDAVMRNSGGGSKATEPSETTAPTVENAGDTSKPDSPSESNSTEATTVQSAQPTAGNTGSENTSSTSSGSTGSTGNTGSTSSSTPAATTPKPTEPPATQPAPTEPAPTSPPEHVHDYSYSTNTVLASCTEPGYTLHICSCGASYRDGETPALGYHNWSRWYITTQPTTQA